MYHFVKYNNIWYLKPETRQDIIDHYNIILKREYEEGFKEFTISIKKYKEIQKLFDPLVKRYFETYYEDWRHFSDWDFDDIGENIIINYCYLDDNNHWEYDSIDISLDRIIEMI